MHYTDDPETFISNVNKVISLSIVFTGYIVYKHNALCIGNRPNCERVIPEPCEWIIIYL